MNDVVKQNVARKRSSKRQHRRSRKHSAYFILVLLLVAGIGLALSMTLLFNVTDIVINDETQTEQSKVIEYSGIHAGDNLVRLDTNIAEQRILASIPYAEMVTVQKKFPSTVVITIVKAIPVANISQSYGYLLVSGSNRVLEELKGAPREGLLIVTGYNPVQGTIGMQLKSEDEKRDNVLKTLTTAVADSHNEMIRCIDMTDQSNVLVQFGQNVVFHMGTSTDAAYKLKLAAATIEKINTHKKYRLTMIGNNQISVIPDENGMIMDFTDTAVTTAPAETTVPSTDTTTEPNPFARTETTTTETVPQFSTEYALPTAAPATTETFGSTTLTTVTLNT